MRYYTEYGGGLGDIFNQIYRWGTYPMLECIAPEDHVDITFICHNPAIGELLQWHSKRSQFTIYTPGYCQPREIAEFKKQHQLPTCKPNLPMIPADVTDIHFFSNPEEADTLSAAMSEPYVVFAPSAGMQNRNIPDALLDPVQLGVLHNTPLRIVHVGKNYGRDYRVEPPVMQHDRVLDMVDKLSIPATAKLVEGSAGVITSHSALNILAWHLRKPQLLLYPQSVVDRHRMGPNPDEWMFGIEFPETTHCLFDQYTEQHVQRFVEKLNG